ncbi:MAG: TlpA family protein disulfide reductase, partial [Planctomycetaceae bacterium]|nr:TlpA family protein disulfide reductase [Planctomycetaceae bacterium]
SVVARLEGTQKRAMGAELNLYGQTLDDEEFDWKALRGKYVLVKFTATWCGPCKGQIPGMLKAYEQYKDKDFEIVSVYIWQREPDPVATIRETVEEEKLPWMIVVEDLTEKAGQPKQGEVYAIQGVPTMLLIDKEGRVISTSARGEELQRLLTEIFETEENPDP